MEVWAERRYIETRMGGIRTIKIELQVCTIGLVGPNARLMTRMSELTLKGTSAVVKSRCLNTIEL